VREFVVRLMPFVVFVCLAAVVGGGLQVRGHFASTALAPALMNLWWIAALFLVIDQFGFERFADPLQEYARQMGIARMLAWYVLVAGLILLGAQLPALRSRGFLGPAGEPRPGEDPRRLRRRVWRVLREAAPLALGAAVYQVNMMITGFMAQGLLSPGGPSVLYYATRLQQLPISLVSAAATAAVFPALAALGHEGRKGELRRLHDGTHLAIAFAALPAVFGLYLFAEPIMAVCFEHGAFGSEGTLRGAAALRALALAILPAGAAGLVARTLYALGDFRTPVRVSILVLLLNVGLNFGLVLGLGMDADGLALSTALCAWLNLLLLLPALRERAGPSADSGRLRRGLLGILLASGAAVGASRLIWAFLGSRCGTAAALFTSIALAAALYALLCQLLRVPEWQAVLSRVRKVVGFRSDREGRRN
jgi:putative peptidoglycan lipid II flippase